MKTTDYLKNVNQDFSFNTFGSGDYNKKGFVKIEDITPNQETLDEKCLKMKIKGKNLSLPHVLQYKGKNILIDGHHTVIAKKINGIKKVFCKITIQ